MVPWESCQVTPIDNAQIVVQIQIQLYCFATYEFPPQPRTLIIHYISKTSHLSSRKEERKNRTDPYVYASVQSPTRKLGYPIAQRALKPKPKLSRAKSKARDTY